MDYQFLDGRLTPLCQPVGLPPPIGLDLYESGQQPRLLDMEAAKRLALDRLIHLAIPLGPPIRQLALSSADKQKCPLLRLRNGQPEIRNQSSG